MLAHETFRHLGWTHTQWRESVVLFISLSATPQQRHHITMKVLIALTMLVGIAASLESCCRYQNIRCNNNQLCDVPTNVEELDQCTEECPLKGCDPLTLLKCGVVLAKCAAVCLPAPLAPPCLLCMGGLFQQCIKCVIPGDQQIVA